METRKVIKIRNSYFINIPSEISEELKIDKGDSLKVGYLSGYGILITKEKGTSKLPVALDSAERLQRLADDIFSDMRRKAKSFEASFTFNMMNRLLGELFKSGLFDLKAKVQDLEEKIKTLNPGRGKIVMLKKRT